MQHDDLIDGSRCEAGDVVVGLPSAGLHANGFTLVRKVLGEGAFDPDLVLAPTRLYLDDIRRLRASTDVRGLAHITGGGIPGNLARVLPAGFGPGSIRLAGSGIPSTLGLTSWGSTRTSSVVSSTWESASARSFRRATRRDAGFPVIGRLEEGNARRDLGGRA